MSTGPTSSRTETFDHSNPHFIAFCDKANWAATDAGKELPLYTDLRAQYVAKLNYAKREPHLRLVYSRDRSDPETLQWTIKNYLHS